MSGFAHKNQAVAEALQNGFLIIKVNYSSENKNEDFLANYPKVPAYPYFLVLENNGTFLHSQRTGVLEEGRSYNEQVFLDFLNEWSPE